MTSILDGAREFITPSLLSSVSSQTGESEAAVSKGFAAVIPTLLASIANRSGDSGFMRQLTSLASKAPTDPDALSRSPQPVVTADGSLDTSTPAGGWLSSLTGGSLSGMTGAIARYAGLRASSASSLLSVGTPLVLGYIGRLMRSDNLDATKLAQRFQSERGAIAAALPSGFDSFLPSARVPTERVRAVASEAVPREKRSAGWVLPLVLAAIAIGGLLWWNSRDRAVVPAASDISRTAGDASTAAGGALSSAAGAVARALPGGLEVNVPAGGTEDRLIGYLASPTGTPGTFDLDRIEFQGGSTTLTPQSREQIENVASILKAYPSARVSIAGYTDNTGDEAANVTLSRGRAEAVMAALQNAGVPAANMTAEGFGSRNPIADNSTEAGRARNRRVSLTVTS